MKSKFGTGNQIELYNEFRILEISFNKKIREIKIRYQFLKSRILKINFDHHQRKKIKSCLKQERRSKKKKLRLLDKGSEMKPFEPHRDDKGLELD